MKRCILLAVFSAASGLGACSRTEPEHAFEPARGEVVARVNGVPITRSELELWAGRARAHAAAADADAGADAEAKALESLVGRELVRQAAYNQRLHEQPGVASKLAALRAQYLAAQRDELAAAFNAHELASAPAVGEADVKAYFERNADVLRTEYHIMQIAYSRDPQAIAEAKRALDEGAAFEAVAARRFAGLPEGQRPWDLGFLRWGQLPPEWREVVAGLAPGRSSGVLKGAGERWWIIHLVEKRVNAGVTFESERQAITTLLQNERLERSRAERSAALRKNADVTYPGR